MKAIIATGYGSPEVLKIQQIAKPIPGDRELLIKIHATSVTAAHLAMRTGKPYIGRLVLGLTKPKNPVMGTDLAGEVAAVGKSVTKFKPGDLVFGSTDLDGGTYAEYTVVPESGVIMAKPFNLSFAEAVSLIEGASTALPFLRDHGKIGPGKKVLIIGASGGIGTAAIQLAKYYGAEVTGVTSNNNLELVKSLGADFVIDYTREDYTSHGKTYDIVFDTVGKSSFNKSKKVLHRNGIYLTTVLTGPALLDMLKTSLFGTLYQGKKAIFAATGMLSNREKRENLKLIHGLAASGYLKPVIDRVMPLDAIAAAHRYIAKGHKRGNLVIEPEWDNSKPVHHNLNYLAAKI